MATAAGPVAARQVAPPEVAVSGDEGTYTVLARFSVAQSVEVARTVISDYERIPSILPDVRRSVIVQRVPQLLVEHEAVSQYGPFSRTLHLLLAVTVDDARIAFVDRSGRSFREYHGYWQLDSHGVGTTITYALTARPAFTAPGFLLSRVMTRDARVAIERLSKAMSERAGGRVHAGSR